MTGHEDQSGLLRELPDEFRIAIRFFAAQSVMEMSHNQFSASRTTQQIEQHDRVEAAGDADAGGLIRRERPEAANKARQKVGRFLHGSGEARRAEVGLQDFRQVHRAVGLLSVLE